MKISLPILDKKIINGKLIKKESEKVFDLDMSIAAQLRFESKFPQMAEKEDLFGYSNRICEVESLSAGVIISKMKMLYCWFDTDLTFVDFLKLFDLTDLEYVNKLANALQGAFKIVFDGSAEKN